MTAVKAMSFCDVRESVAKRDVVAVFATVCTPERSWRRAAECTSGLVDEVAAECTSGRVEVATQYNCKARR